MRKPILAFAALVALATSAVAATATTLTYTGARFDTVTYSGPPRPTSDKPAVGPYTTSDRVVAVIELDIDIGASWSMKDMTPHIIAFHTLTDGVIDHVNFVFPYVFGQLRWLDLSTDAEGNITDWSLNAFGGSGDFVSLSATRAGDRVAYSYETGYFDPEILALFPGSTGLWCCTGESASASSRTPGTWTVAPAVVPLPASWLALAGGVGLLGLTRRRKRAA
jgi:hypothetical protein